MAANFRTQMGSRARTVTGGPYGGQFNIKQSYMYENVPGKRPLDITLESLEAIEELLRWVQYRPRLFPKAADQLCRMLATLDMGFAQKYSAGWKRDPKDTRRAWVTPVPRITWRYYLGWQVKKIRTGYWIMYNHSREAFYIEFGLHQTATRKVRRPVMKLAFRKVMTSTYRTSLESRVWANTFYPRPGQPGTRARNLRWYMHAPSAPMTGIPGFGVMGTPMILS
jgi:hypothetical protein